MKKIIRLLRNLSLCILSIDALSANEDKLLFEVQNSGEDLNFCTARIVVKKYLENKVDTIIHYVSLAEDTTRKKNSSPFHSNAQKSFSRFLRNEGLDDAFPKTVAVDLQYNGSKRNDGPGVIYNDRVMDPLRKLVLEVQKDYTCRRNGGLNLIVNPDPKMTYRSRSTDGLTFTTYAYLKNE